MANNQIYDSRRKPRRPTSPMDTEVLQEMAEAGELEYSPEVDAIGEITNSGYEPSSTATGQGDSQDRQREGLESGARWYESATEFFGRIDRSVREKPWNYIFGIGALGLIVGFFIRRSK